MKCDTRYWCKICQVRLCVKKCFEVYHTETDITKSMPDVVEEESFEESFEEEEIEALMPGNILQHTDSDIDDSIDLQSLFNTV